MSAWWHGLTVSALMARPHGYNLSAQCHGLTVGASMAWPHEYHLPHPPQPKIYLYSDLPPSRQLWSLHHMFCLSWCVGGVVVVTITPSHTSASVVISISPTRVTTLSATESCAVPVVLALQVSGAVSPDPFPVSPVGSPISATIELTLPWWVHDVPTDPDVGYHWLPIMSLYRHMWARAGPDAISLREEA